MKFIEPRERTRYFNHLFFSAQKFEVSHSRLTFESSANSITITPEQKKRNPRHPLSNHKLTEQFHRLEPYLIQQSRDSERSTFLTEEKMAKSAEGMAVVVPSSAAYQEYR